ncbi:MAG: endonuclease/exonuclease/phosphatase family protein [Ignavibacteria bacterium]|nr:endonuclease/exonuclease/phosphatase family protein [Ignavibacteria bacterium]
MTYNVLNLTLGDTLARNPYFRTIFSSIQPDILVCQEMTSQTGVNGFLSRVLNRVSTGYAAGTFINGLDTDNAIYYKSSLFTFLSNTPINTELRDINEFRLRYNSTGDTIIIYSVHLKASSSSSDSLKRAAEVDSLRKRTNALPLNSNFIVVGDFNIYDSSELAFQKLLNQSQSGYFIDPLSLIGRWNNNGSFAPYHTQSTRVRDLFDGGATGGLDDRFDMILMSQEVMNSGGITYNPGTYNEYGNDGNHFNDSINQPPNTVVSQQVADALHYATDHLPVYATFSFDTPYLEISSLTALLEGFFNGLTMNPDTVTVELRNVFTPYSLVDQAKVYLNNNGQGTAKFYSAENGVPYYLILNHRNAIETWSASPQTFTTSTLNYDFTSGADKAYGNNLKLVGSKWCIYGGDVNNDGYVETADLNLVFNDNVNGAVGYILTDLNGDLITEIEDLNIVFINNVLGVERKTPPGF